MMRSAKLLLFMLLICITSYVSAQDDDWQIAGGATNRTGTTAYRNGASRNSFAPRSYNLWNGGYDKKDFGLIIGYVNKQWTSKYSSKTRSENLFGEEGKRLHGMQIGLQYTPSFNFGLGMRTGLFYECYISSSPYVKDQGWDRFNEHDLYIPAQAMMRFPFTNNSSLSIFGGIGFQWAIYGTYREWGHTAYSLDGDSYYYGPEQYQKYGNDWPRHVNWQVEAGFLLRISDFLFNCSYSYGLTNHRLYSTEYGYASNSRQDKIQFSIGYAF